MVLKVEKISKDHRELKCKVQLLENSLMKNNVEIVNCPAVVLTDLKIQPKQLVQRIATAVGFKLANDDLSRAHLTGKVYEVDSVKCQTVVAVLSNSKFAEEFNVKVNDYRRENGNKLDSTRVCSRANSTNISVFRQVCRETKHLRWRAKRKQLAINYKFCWLSHDGKVLMRKSEGVPAVWIRSEEDLEKLK